jgi:PAS domain S-box-containing protein
MGLLEVALSTTDDAISVFDGQARYLFVNDSFCRRLGLRPDEIIGKTPTELDFYPPQIASLLITHIVMVFKNGKKITNELPAIAFRNGVRKVEYVLTQVVAPGGEITAVVATGRDLTAVHRARDALRDASRQKDEFLATLAHELRNPLAPIVTAAHVLASLTTESEVVLNCSRLIERQSRQMALLLDDLLDVARISVGRLQLRKKQVTVESVIASALETTRPKTEARRHTVTVSAVNASVVIDPVRVSQVIANLLNNAAKYTEEGGQISVNASIAEGMLVISVQDSGIGIAQRTLPRVFDMFAQEQTALERSDGGLGIGLALVKGIVEMHGGCVWAESPGLGKGSTFYIEVPAEGISELQPMGVPPAREGLAACALSILIADDNVDAATSLGMLLELRGHNVVTVTDGVSAVDAIKRQPFDVVILDLGMPKMNGYEVATEIRDLDLAEQPLLLAATGWGQESDRRRTVASGFDHHLVKPIEIDALLNILDSRKPGVNQVE